MDPAFQRRAFIVCLILVAGLSALSVRLISLQVWDRRVSDTKPLPRFKLRETIPARYGDIMDRHRNPLTQSRIEAALIVDLNHLTSVDILVWAVARREARTEAGWEDLAEDERNERLFQIRRKIRRTLTDEEIIAAHLDFAADVIGPQIRMSTRELFWAILHPGKKFDPDFRMSNRELVKKLKGGLRQVIVKKALQDEVAKHLEEALQTCRIQGFRFERSQKREYLMPNLAPHLIGTRDFQGVGKSGLEKSMDDILAGRDGEKILKRDENNLVNLTELEEVIRPVMGQHVRTTLDMGLQAIIEEELGMAFEAYQAKHGSIIVVDPHNGDILAMASRPDFNLNARESFRDAWTSFAVSAQYEPGSVMKIVAMAAALDRGGVTRETVVHCGWGSIARPGFRIPDHHPYGELSFDMVMVKSSNTGVFQFAETVGREGFYRALRDFGFGQRTGFPIPGEAKGNIENPLNMSNFARATFGYSVSVTPLQLAMAYSVLANGGTLLQPRLVDSIIAGDGTLLDQTPVRKVRRVIREETAREMCLSLEQVVLKGTGKNAQVPGYRAGGKTGTAYKWDAKLKKYDPDKRFLTFAGLLPVDDPKFVCIVTFDEPTTGEPSVLPEDFELGGGTIAAPVFSQVAGRIARFMDLPSNEDTLTLNSAE